MHKTFPRKEFFIRTLSQPLGEGNVFALHDEQVEMSEYLKKYSEEKWDAENKGWKSSEIASTVFVEHNGKMVLHCGMSEYKYLLGMVKLTSEIGSTNYAGEIGGLSTEIMSLTTDGCFFLEQRARGQVQHGVGCYDIPNAGHSAQMWIDKLPSDYTHIVRDIFDMIGFPKWNLIRHLQLTPEEIGDIFYTGFVKGFEVSINFQFNGYVKISVSAEDIITRVTDKRLLCYKFNDVFEIFEMLGGTQLKPDVFGNIPDITLTKNFKMVEHSLATLLSNLYHLKGKDAYEKGLAILRDKGYVINEISAGKTSFKDLK